MASRQRPLGKRIRYFMVRMFTTSVDALARVLPLGWLRRLAILEAHLLRLLVPSRQRLACENIRKAFGDRFTAAERRRIALQSTINICQTMGELLKMRYISPEEVKRLVSLHGAEHIRAAQQRGKGVMMLSAHLGNWELGGARITAEGYPMVVVARDATEVVTAGLINQARTRQNMTVIGREDLRAMLQALRSNKALGILPDQYAARGGILVDFLGRTTLTATGPAVLALRTGCAIVPFFTTRRPDGSLETQVFPALEVTTTGERNEDVRVLTEKINRIIAEQITAHPEQWLWLHDRWKVDKDKPDT